MINDDGSLVGKRVVDAHGHRVYVSAAVLRGNGVIDRIVKSLVAPEGGLTLSPVCVMVGVRDVKSVLQGTVSVIVLASIEPSIPSIEKSDISFSVSASVFASASVSVSESVSISELVFVSRTD